MALVLCQEAGTSAQICLPETCSGLSATTFLPAGRVISVIVDGTGSSKKTEPAEKKQSCFFHVTFKHAPVSPKELGTVWECTGVSYLNGRRQRGDIVFF